MGCTCLSARGLRRQEEAFNWPWFLSFLCSQVYFDPSRWEWGCGGTGNAEGKGEGWDILGSPCGDPGRGCSTLGSMGVMPVVTVSKDKPCSTWLSRCGLLCQGRQSLKRVKVRILLWAVMLRKEANGVVTSTAKVRPRHLELLKC